MNTTNVGATIAMSNSGTHSSGPAFSEEQQQKLKNIDDNMTQRNNELAEKKQSKKRYFKDDAEYIKLEQDELWAKKLYTIFEKITSECTVCPAAKRKKTEWAGKKQEYETNSVNYEKKHWNEETTNKELYSNKLGETEPPGGW